MEMATQIAHLKLLFASLECQWTTYVHIDRKSGCVLVEGYCCNGCEKSMRTSFNITVSIFQNVQMKFPTNDALT